MNYDDEPMTKKRAKKIIDVMENDSYGHYVYDYSDLKEAKAFMQRRRRLPK